MSLLYVREISVQIQFKIFTLTPPPLPTKRVLAYVSTSVIIYILLNKCILPLLNKGLALFLACGIYDATVALADNGFLKRSLYCVYSVW